MLTAKLRVSRVIAVLTIVLGLTGCLSGGGTPTATTATASSTAASIILASSAASVKADGSTTTTLTATVVDAARLPVAGATVEFSATAGQFGVSSGVSSSGGTVTISYSATSSTGTSNLAERTETVTAKVVGTSVAAKLPVQVTSTAVAPAAALILASSLTSLKADGSNSSTITATVVDSNGLAVSGAAVRFDVKSGSGHFITASSGLSSAAGVVTISYSALSSVGTSNQTDHTDTLSITVVGTAVTGEITIPVTASSLSLLVTASPSSVKTDGSTSTMITASVIDNFRAPVPGQKVVFTAPTGLLGTSSGDSKPDGTVTIPFSALSVASTSDRTNRTEVVTASIVGTSVKAQIPIQIVGSTLAIMPSKSTAQVGETISLVAAASDAAANGVSGQSIRLTIDNKSTGAGALSTTSVVSAAGGTTPAVTLSITAPGNLTITADWLNAAGNQTLTTSTTIVVTAIGIPFALTSPVTNPTSLALAASQDVSLSVPTLIAGVTVASVRFATTLGTWSNSSKSSVVSPVANTARETLSAGSNSGNANIQIDALDSAGKVLATLNRVFALSAATGTKISLQPSVSIIAPSTGGTTNSATLTATVRDVNNNTVGNAPVLFEIVNPTGSGEQITPVIAYTTSDGQAVATFTSGALSTVGGLQIKATLVGTAVADTKSINVSGTSVSLTLGQASGVGSTDNGTTYTLPMAVLVVSSTGGAVSGATVTLSAFPTHYYRGHRESVSTKISETVTTTTTCVPIKTKAGRTALAYVSEGSTAFPNEDANENDILDAAEDYDPIGDGRGIGSITPPHAAAGTLPPTVVTGANGVGTFNLVYLKSYADWVKTRIRAKAVVNGTEFVNELKFDLPASSSDTGTTTAAGGGSGSACGVPDSPFGP